ncbi:MAG: DUF2293 domain-containing protein [Deltaproteobacteria bacterium]|nr:DUF2293 domain-containing protein [Deltaproteobacteria bacterium]
MATANHSVSKGRRTGYYLFADGVERLVPEDWTLLPPGDATLTRRVKAATDSWTVQEKKGRRTFSKGVLAAAEVVEHVRAALDAERNTPAYQKKLEASRRRSAQHQVQYVRDFQRSVADYLDFHPRHAVFETALADAVTRHATPVGSGTVARTKRIPVEARAEAAVIAWMRHQTTAYDNLSIPRVRGARRQVRRLLAQRSKALLENYRRGIAPDRAQCPLAQALAAR